MILTNNTLIFCRQGIDLFKEHFEKKKYKGQNELVIPYNFLLLAATDCNKGEFYELEYTTTELGFVYRALIQAVNPDTDIMMMLGTAKRYGVLPDGFTPRQAFKRGDINKVHIVGCLFDDHGEPTIIGPEREACYGTDISIANRIFDGAPTCIEYYANEQMLEMSVHSDDLTAFDPIFVCGGENVNKPIFAERRKLALQEMNDLFEQAIDIAHDYKLNYVVAFETGEIDKEGNNMSQVSACYNETYCHNLAHFLLNNKQ